MKIKCVFGLHDYKFGRLFVARPAGKFTKAQHQEAKCKCCGKVKAVRV